MNRQRSSIGVRVFWALLALGLAALAVGAIVAIATAGDRARGSTAGIELGRVGLLAFLVSGTLAFGLAAGSGLVRWRTRNERADLGILVFVAGLTIATAAMVPIVAIMPTEPGRNPVPDVLRIPLYIGGAVLLLGFAGMAAPAVREGIRKRDPAMLIALLLLVAFVVLRMLRRI